MTSLNRRNFLKRMAATGVAMSTSGAWSRTAGASPWGCTGACNLSNLRVLEIFCYGGLSQWENFWVSDDHGLGLNWRAFHDEVQALDWSGCSNGPSSSTHTEYFADSASGTAIHWGPATRPLWSLMPYIRPVVVQPGTSLGVHALGIHKGLTGRSLGDPRAASLGAAIQHHAQSIEQQTLPYSYVLSPNDPGSFGYVTNYAAAPGRHPGSATPLSLKLDSDGFGDLLARNGMSSNRDAILSELRSQYRDLLRYQGMGSTVRAPGHTSFEAASHYTFTAADELHDRLGGDALALDNSSTCVLHPDYDGASRDNATRRSMQLAAYLLKNAGARYVGVIDGGIARTPEGDAPYDTHCNGSDNAQGEKEQRYSHVQVTSANLWNMLDALAEILQPPSAPSGASGGVFNPVDQYATQTLPEEIVDIGSPSPFSPGAKVSLANTLVIINTEFNRTPGKSNFGRNHSESSGHVALLMGGPVNGGAIAGDIVVDSADSLETATPEDFATPAGIHASVLEAMGIDMWAGENFRQSDDFGPLANPGGETSEDDIRDNLRNHVLGLS